MPHQGRIYHKLATFTADRGSDDADLVFVVGEPIQNCRMIQLCNVTIHNATSGTTDYVDLVPANQSSQIFDDCGIGGKYRSLQTSFVGSNWVEQHEPGIIVAHRPNTNIRFGENNEFRLKALRDEAGALLAYDRITLRFLLTFVDMQSTQDSRNWRHGPQDLGSDAHSAFHNFSNNIWK